MVLVAGGAADVDAAADDKLARVAAHLANPLVAREGLRQGAPAAVPGKMPEALLESGRRQCP
eukprot:3791659-Pyramimonas_sp.AAC.1